mgnify:CR=1 FL=1
MNWLIGFSNDCVLILWLFTLVWVNNMILLLVLLVVHYNYFYQIVKCCIHIDISIQFTYVTPVVELECPKILTSQKKRQIVVCHKICFQKRKENTVKILYH